MKYSAVASLLLTLSGTAAALDLEASLRGVEGNVRVLICMSKLEALILIMSVYLLYFYAITTIWGKRI